MRPVERRPEPLTPCRSLEDVERSPQTLLICKNQTTAGVIHGTLHAGSRAGPYKLLGLIRSRERLTVNRQAQLTNARTWQLPERVGKVRLR